MSIVLEGGATSLGANAKLKKYKTITTTTSQGYNPLQLGSLAANDCIGPMDVADLSMEVAMTVGHGYYSACFMDIALLELSPKAESAYLKEPSVTITVFPPKFDF
jgi:hypothetical protein